MLEKVEKFIVKNRLIKDGDSVLVGLSGGPDSVALLHCLFRLREKMKLRIGACHLNHHIRGNEAGEDAKFALSFAKDLGIPFFSGDADIPAIKQRCGGTIEEIARAERYAFFCRTAKEWDAGIIALGHNADDTVETFFLNLMRGAGLRGLAGIPAKRYENNYLIVRPLLSVTKSEILDYLKSQNLTYRVDSTNLEDTYTRNKIRLKLLPYLRENFNPKISEAILNTSRYLRDCSDYVFREIDFSISHFTKVIENGFSMPANALDNYHPIQKSLTIRRLFENFFNVNINETMYENVKSILDGTRRYCEFSHQGIIISREYDTIKFREKQNIDNRLFITTVKIPSVNLLPEWNMRVELSVHNVNKVPGMIYLTEKPSFGKIWKSVATGIEQVCITEFFDADAIGEKRLIIRSKIEGDKYKPLGKSGSCYLKKLFIDGKLPITLKDRIPVFIANDRIIYVAGHRIAEQVKITKKTKRVLKLYLSLFPL